MAAVVVTAAALDDTSWIQPRRDDGSLLQAPHRHRKGRQKAAGAKDFMVVAI